MSTSNNTTPVSIPTMIYMLGTGSEKAGCNQVPKWYERRGVRGEMGEKWFANLAGSQGNYSVSTKHAALQKSFITSSMDCCEVFGHVLRRPA